MKRKLYLFVVLISVVMFGLAVPAYAQSNTDGGVPPLYISGETTSAHVGQVSTAYIRIRVGSAEVFSVRVDTSTKGLTHVEPVSWLVQFNGKFYQYCWYFFRNPKIMPVFEDQLCAFGYLVPGDTITIKFKYKAVKLGVDYFPVWVMQDTLDPIYMELPLEVLPR
ncbi:MAG: hypothetical protein HYV90_03485 [Candidatus Woesebacteria bacterium]|nr:MAG: hypothetical protein HYV90_03485 [Candidatus Woesebacteria bacterium]